MPNDPAGDLATVEEISVEDMSPMMREINHGLMVAFINRELLERYMLDVRHSIVLYDADKCFAFALPDELTESQKESLAATTGVRYWSRGVGWPL